MLRHHLGIFLYERFLGHTDLELDKIGHHLARSLPIISVDISLRQVVSRCLMFYYLGKARRLQTKPCRILPAAASHSGINPSDFQGPVWCTEGCWGEGVPGG